MSRCPIRTVRKRPNRPLCAPYVTPAEAGVSSVAESMTGNHLRTKSKINVESAPRLAVFDLLCYNSWIRVPQGDMICTGMTESLVSTYDTAPFVTPAEAGAQTTHSTNRFMIHRLQTQRSQLGPRFREDDE
jgi:hypothetical protein